MVLKTEFGIYPFDLPPIIGPPLIQVVSDALKQEYDAGNPNQLKLFNS